MKVTIITDVLNSKDTIEETIKSVLGQTHGNIEYIIIDGASNDGTVEVIDKYRDRIFRFISETDKNHFEAMNKGLTLASGDIVGFLHADDLFAGDRIVEKVANTFMEKNVDCLWGDLVYVARKDTERVIRYWVSCAYHEGLFEKGWMPPHPTFFAKNRIYKKYGNFNTDLPIASDYDVMMRFLYRYRISSYYIPEVLINMRMGGLSNSSLSNMIKKSREDLRVCKLNGLKGGIRTITRKNISKISQFFCEARTLLSK